MALVKYFTYRGSQRTTFARGLASPQASTLPIKNPITRHCKPINTLKHNPVCFISKDSIVRRGHKGPNKHNVNFVVAWSNKYHLPESELPCWYINSGRLHGGTSFCPCTKKSLSWVCFPICFGPKTHYIVYRRIS